MTIREGIFWQKNIITDFYSISIKQEISSTRITMKFFIDELNTAKIPCTYRLLKKHLPGIFNSACFNYKKIPFCEEVKNTEIGHLFEHILLENLYNLKVLESNKVIYSAQTYWNWRKDDLGTFHININSGFGDYPIFIEAIQKSIDALNIILSHHLNEKSKIQNYFRNSQYKQMAN